MTKGCRVPWLALALLASVALCYGGVWALRALSITLPACPMKTHLGIPCATCGLTRCALALREGHWAEAFHWHPIAVVLGLLTPLVMGWDLRRAWQGAPYHALPDSWIARLSIASLVMGTWMLQIVRGI
jgi:hypothetical protein